MHPRIIMKNFNKEFSMLGQSKKLLDVAKFPDFSSENASEDSEEGWSPPGQRNQSKRPGQKAASLHKQVPSGADLPSCTGYLVSFSLL